MAILPTARRLALCSTILAGAIVATALPAAAGECPSDKVVTDSNMMSDAAAQGVSDVVIASIDLAEEAPKLDNRMFRLRRLEIAPGGIVPWHAHAERPAIIYIVEGEVVEHSSTCAVPIVHRAGEVSTETHMVSHWWQNETDKPVVLLSTDILHVKDDPAQM
jgi:quercetin dioxygenase-like cupin family protein